MIVNVIHIHHATASKVLKKNIPVNIPIILSSVENKPHINKLLVSFAAWKIEPEVDKMICIPTDMDKIWNTGTEGIHCSPKMINMISLEQEHNNTDKGNPINAKKRITLLYEIDNFVKSFWKSENIG